MPPTLPERVGTLEARTADLAACSAEMATVLMGTPRSELAGGGRNTDGMTHKVDRLGIQVANVEARLANGGIRTRLSGRDRATILAALFAALGAAIPAIITLAS